MPYIEKRSTLSVNKKELDNRTSRGSTVLSPIEWAHSLCFFRFWFFCTPAAMLSVAYRRSGASLIARSVC